jgi:hypothetical protein
MNNNGCGPVVIPIHDRSRLIRAPRSPIHDLILCIADHRSRYRTQHTANGCSFEWASALIPDHSASERSRPCSEHASHALIRSSVAVVGTNAGDQG